MQQEKLVFNSSSGELGGISSQFLNKLLEFGTKFSGLAADLLLANDDRNLLN
jgi:hypothetical protein